MGMGTRNGDGKKIEGKYYSGWMGERSVPITSAEGYCCATPKLAYPGKAM